MMSRKAQEELRYGSEIKLMYDLKEEIKGLSMILKYIVTVINLLAGQLKEMNEKR